MNDNKSKKIKNKICDSKINLEVISNQEIIKNNKSYNNKIISKSREKEIVNRIGENSIKPILEKSKFLNFIYSFRSIIISGET